MKIDNTEENLRVTSQKVKQQPSWENMNDEMAENMAKTIRRLAELFYITIAREMSLNPVPETDVGVRDEKPKSRKKGNQKIELSFSVMLVFVFRCHQMFVFVQKIR